MEPKIAQFINKGMQQDYSISKASNEFAFKNHNIRITTRGENSLLTVTNEKSNKKLSIVEKETNIAYNNPIKGETQERIEYEYNGDYQKEIIVTDFFINKNIDLPGANTCFCLYVDEFGINKYSKLENIQNANRSLLYSGRGYRYIRRVIDCRTKSGKKAYCLVLEYGTQEYYAWSNVIGNRVNEDEYFFIVGVRKKSYDSDNDIIEFKIPVGSSEELDLNNSNIKQVIYLNEDPVVIDINISSTRLIPKNSFIGTDTICYSTLEKRFYTLNESNIIKEEGILVNDYFDVTQIEGITIGTCVCNDCIVLFQKQETVDSIIKLFFENDYVIYNVLYSGNLGFNINYPIETLYNYESEKVEKIYWVDGINQPRVINIKNYIKSNNNAQFDFNPITKTPTVDIVKNTNTDSGFTAGTIQYIITYYNNFAQESSPVYVSPIQYLSKDSGGVEPGKKASCNFTLKISNVDNNWDNIRIYSIVRNSVDSSAIGYLVYEGTINTSDEDDIITISDDGINNEIVDATQFLFTTDDFIPSTIAAKGDKLFFGDLNIPHDTLSEELEDNIRKSVVISWYDKPTKFNSESKAVYSYENQLKYSEKDIKGFKSKEKYRFAIQFQNNRSIWGEPIYIGDFVNTLHPTATSLPAAKLTIDKSLISQYLTDNNITNVRLLRAELQDQDRTIVSQGFVCPTVYNAYERANGVCYSSSSWVQRFSKRDGHFKNVNSKTNEYANYEIPHCGELVECDLESSISRNDSSKVAKKVALKSVGLIFEYKLEGNNGTIGLDEITFTLALLSEDNYEVSTTNVNATTIGVHNYNSGYTSWDYYYKTFKYKNNKSKFITNLEEAYNAVLTNLQSTKIKTLRFLGTASSITLIELINESLKSNGYDLIIDSLSNVEEDKNLFITNVESSALEGLSASKEDVKQAFKEAVDGFPQALDNLDTVSNCIFDYFSNTEEHIENIKNTSLRNTYFIDASSFTYHSPNILDDYSGLNFRIVGYAPLRNNISSFNIEVDNQKGSSINYGFNSFVHDNKEYLYSHYLWKGAMQTDSNTSIDSSILLGMWHPSGSIVNDFKDNRDALRRKVIGNMWYCSPSEYRYEGTSILWKGNGIIAKKIYDVVDINSNVYKSKYENVLLPLDDASFERPYIESSTILNKEEAERTEDIKKLFGEYTSCLIKYSSPECVMCKLNKDERSQTLLVLPGYDVNYNSISNPKIKSTGELLNESSRREVYGRLFNTPIYTSSAGDVARTIIYNTINPYIQEGDYVIVGAVLEDSYKNDISTIVGFQEPVYVALIESFIDKTKTGENRKAFSISDFEENHLFSTSIISKYCLYKVFSVENTSEYIDFVPVKNVILNPVGSSSFVSPELLVRMNNKNIFEGIPNSGSIPKDYNETWYKDFRTIAYTDRIGTLKLYSSTKNLGSYYSNIPVIGKEGIKVNSIYSPLQYGNAKEHERFHDFLKSKECVLIGEFYRDSEYQYGGTTKQALDNTKYVVCSESYPISNEDSEIIIENTYGDTYYQRWDCLRTYPTTEEDINSVVDVVSIMIESYNNLDGRYDSNRGRLDVHNTRETNSNLINNVYSQVGNFFSVYDTDRRLRNNNLKNCYTWSLGKTNNELIDNWTKGLLVNINSLDGSKGKITKLQLWKDYLLSFQERGIARIHYNDQTTVGSIEGVPIEIANSQTVNGHNYLSELVGCSNKWTIATSEAGIYFVDSISKSINLFNGQINNITYNKAFKDWSKDNLNDLIWTPKNNKAYYGVYDRLNHEYYITNKDNCLCFSEDLNAFVSFYDYTKSPIMISFKDKLIGVQNNNDTSLLWEQFVGDGYCNFYGEQKDYSVEYNINTDPISDKVFTNLEYRAYVDNSDDTFDKLEVSNEYQHGESNPNRRTRHVYPNAERKFRIWRTDIPRDTNSRRSLDRIRSPWMKLKLTKNTNTNNKMNFHDLLVKYYE